LRDCLAKPFTHKELLDALSKLLEKKALSASGAAMAPTETATGK
jgi:hypothetical protein